MTRFETAREMYGNIGVDVDSALAKLQKGKISSNCWQGDDVGVLRTREI